MHPAAAIVRCSEEGHYTCTRHTVAVARHTPEGYPPCTRSAMDTRALGNRTHKTTLGLPPTPVIRQPVLHTSNILI